MKKQLKLRWLTLILWILLFSSGCSAKLSDLNESEVGTETQVVENKEMSGVNNSSEQTLSSEEFNRDEYRIIEVDGGDLSGLREVNVKVDIGFGNREYWAYTNEFSQLIRVEADQVILQDSSIDKVLSNGRYYKDEAKVPGVESPDLDEGHVIADSLGGVSNAYNITPQNSTLNRHGDQAYMEKVIRDAGGCESFVAEITYPDTTTQIPSHYKYSYVLKGNQIVDEFDNVNPDEANKDINSVESAVSNLVDNHDINTIDKNGNGIVTIKEAKAAGFKMPISKDHWLYEYMIDLDGDGQVGE